MYMYMYMYFLPIKAPALCVARVHVPPAWGHLVSAVLHKAEELQSYTHMVICKYIENVCVHIYIYIYIYIYI
jgi:hypothetical protein